MTRELALLVSEHSDARGMSRFALTMLALRADEQGDVSITNPDLGDLIGTDGYTAGRHIRALMQSGAIVRLARGRGARPSRFHVNAPKGAA